MKLSIKQAAERAGVCSSIVYGWVSESLVPVYRLGGKGRRGKILIEASDLDAYLESCRVPARRPAPALAPSPRCRPADFRHLTIGG
jgi:excisionase family DNA binding protein